MPAQIIDGKTIAENILLDLKTKITGLKRQPGLAVILVGDDPASHLYVKNKKKAAQKIGVVFNDYYCGQKCCPQATAKEVLEMIDFLNNDQAIDGIIVQLPLPKNFDREKIINQISPAKDVDGFHSQNQKDYLADQSPITPPLIGAVNEALKATGQNLAGKNAVIVAKGEIFAEALKKDLENQGLKVKISKPDRALAGLTKQADVLVVILGQKKFITKNMVKPEAIIIDIGTNLIGENKFVGDASPEVAEVAGFLTPVPGGIGPLTVAMLLKNVYELAKNNQ
ncbi:MAG: bifunctional 5,10-methylenetetrahydrofolate dehydrogenase/5,10-methenyltetrahydrofolate cyclohydrolase [Candidatus Buchananbacteria bacterium]